MSEHRMFLLCNLQKIFCEHVFCSSDRHTNTESRAVLHQRKTPINNHSKLVHAFSLVYIGEKFQNLNFIFAAQCSEA